MLEPQGLIDIRLGRVLSLVWGLLWLNHLGLVMGNAYPLLGGGTQLDQVFILVDVPLLYVFLCILGHIGLGLFGLGTPGHRLINLGESQILVHLGVLYLLPWFLWRHLLIRLVILILQTQLFNQLKCVVAQYWCQLRSLALNAILGTHFINDLPPLGCNLPWYYLGLLTSRDYFHFLLFMVTMVVVELQITLFLARHDVILIPLPSLPWILPCWVLPLPDCASASPRWDIYLYNEMNELALIILTIELSLLGARHLLALLRIVDRSLWVLRCRRIPALASLVLSAPVGWMLPRGDGDPLFGAFGCRDIVLLECGSHVEMVLGAIFHIDVEVVHLLVRTRVVLGVSVLQVMETLLLGLRVVIGKGIDIRRGGCLVLLLLEMGVDLLLLHFACDWVGWRL